VGARDVVDSHQGGGLECLVKKTSSLVALWRVVDAVECCVHSGQQVLLRLLRTVHQAEVEEIFFWLDQQGSQGSVLIGVL